MRWTPDMPDGAARAWIRAATFAVGRPAVCTIGAAPTDTARQHSSDGGRSSADGPLTVRQWGSNVHAAWRVTILTGLTEIGRRSTRPTGRRRSRSPRRGPGTG